MKTTNVNPKMTWNEFLNLCGDAWKNENSNVEAVKFVRGFLIRARKTTNMSLIQIASVAYQSYKKD